MYVIIKWHIDTEKKENHTFTKTKNISYWFQLKVNSAIVN